MSSSPFILCASAFLYISLAEAQVFFAMVDYEEYYTTVCTTTYEIYPQDDIDAQAMINKGMLGEVVGGILPYREKIRRMTIIRQINAKCEGHDYMTDAYVPLDQSNGRSAYIDLIFGLTKDENIVLGAYLQVFFDRKDQNWIIIPMVLAKDIQQVIATYDQNHAPSTFKELRKKQDSPFENMLRVWVRQNREANEKGDLDKNQVTQDANSLKSENDDGGWHENRDQIENIFMKKSIKYAQAVIAEFEKALGKPIEEVIQCNVQCHQLDQGLANAYSSLARYIKNRHKYIAEIMAQYCNMSDEWAAWIICVAVVCPKEWPKIDAEFQKANKGKSLTKFIVEKEIYDKTLAEMFAVVIDPKFKPTMFSKIPPVDDSGADSTLPPTTPTTVAGSPTSPASG